MGKKLVKINLDLMVGMIVGMCHKQDIDFYKTCEGIKKIIEDYTEGQTDAIYNLFSKPRQELKVLEDLWRKENSPDKFVIPDQTEFYKWITRKIIKDK